MGFQARDANLYRYVGNGPTNQYDPFGLANFYNFNVHYLPLGASPAQVQA